LGRLLILLVLVAGVVWFLHWFRSNPPERVARVLRRGALWGVVGLLMLLALTGRLSPLFAALAAAVPVAMRAISLLRMLPAIQQILRLLGLPARSGGGVSGPSGGTDRTSSIRTRLLEMTLDHATGTMDGLVLEGAYQGRLLSSLGLDQLLDLLDRCRAQDGQSAAVLEAYLDRTQGEGWREGQSGHRARDQGPAANASGGRMSREEALAVLGLRGGARDEEVRDAHRRLMQRFHPDRGGSDYLAAKINEAKRLLLGE
jgi:hypothetical protein